MYCLITGEKKFLKSPHVFDKITDGVRSKVDLGFQLH